MLKNNFSEKKWWGVINHAREVGEATSGEKLKKGVTNHAPTKTKGFWQITVRLF